jgi:hypothetical protein
VQLPLILLLDGGDMDRAPDLALPVVPAYEHFHQLDCVEAIRLGPPLAAVDLNAGGVDDLVLDPLVQQEAMQPEAVASYLVARARERCRRRREVLSIRIGLLPRSFHQSGLADTVF